MLRILVLLTAVCAVIGGDGFAKKYAYSKVMTNCVGEETYYDFMRSVMQAKKECYSEKEDLPPHHHSGPVAATPVTYNRFPTHPVYYYYTPQANVQLKRFPVSYPYAFYPQRQKRDAIYDGPVLHKMIAKVKAKVSNFTCVMKKTGFFKDDFTIDYEEFERMLRALNIKEDLKQDFIKGMKGCKDFTTCLPLELMRSPMPLAIQQAIALNKCWKKVRMAVCMKHDLIKYLDEFDVSALPYLGDKEEGEVAEKLLHVLWGVEAKDDFELY